MNKLSLIIVLLLSLYVIAFGSMEQKTTTKPIVLIYNYRNHIAEVIFHSPYSNLYKMYKYKDSSFVCWEKNEADIIDEFVDGYLHMIRVFSHFQYYFQDSVSISILANLCIPVYSAPDSGDNRHLIRSEATQMLEFTTRCRLS